MTDLADAVSQARSDQSERSEYTLCLESIQALGDTLEHPDLRQSVGAGHGVLDLNFYSRTPGFEAEPLFAISYVVQPRPWRWVVRLFPSLEAPGYRLVMRYYRPGLYGWHCWNVEPYDAEKAVQELAKQIVYISSLASLARRNQEHGNRSGPASLQLDQAVRDAGRGFEV